MFTYGRFFTANTSTVAAQASSTKGQFSTIQHEDGKYQWAINGKPLYFYALCTSMLFVLLC
ncbi:COG4315 family predicted lipoprotein [Psychrobacter urativorans]|uniref:hypothetical protein n=1 Tax=Psychrobacter urativorans TaxID=45610 RepID=UPI001919444C